MQIEVIVDGTVLYYGPMSGYLEVGGPSY